MTQYVPAIGATCLGVVIAYLVRYFIRRFSNFGAGALGLSSQLFWAEPSLSFWRRIGPFGGFIPLVCFLDSFFTSGLRPGLSRVATAIVTETTTQAPNLKGTTSPGPMIRE